MQLLSKVDERRVNLAVNRASRELASALTLCGLDTSLALNVAAKHTNAGLQEVKGIVAELLARP